MIEIGYFMTIITLYKQGESQRKIARLVGHDRKTVRRIIKLYKEKGVIEPIRKQKESVLGVQLRNLHCDAKVSFRLGVVD